MGAADPSLGFAQQMIRALASIERIGWDRPQEQLVLLPACASEKDLVPIMRARLDMCKEKGFDAVDPDNINGYESENVTRFLLTAEHQLIYNRWLADEAHASGARDGSREGRVQAGDRTHHA